MKWQLIILFCTGLTVNLSAQHHLTDDTITISEVLIRSDLPDGSSGFRKTEFTDAEIQSVPGISITDFLAANTSLYIKDYGSGGLKSVSFRGMGPGHTTVLWEGLRIDNPMLGQSDLSLVPLMFIDNISLYYGGNPDIFGNRGSGGTISMSSDPGWGSDSNVSFYSELGSYGSFNEGISLSLRSPGFIYSLRAYAGGARNNYLYTDNVNYAEPRELRREGADYRSRGLLQEISFKSRSSVLAAKLWYNFNNKNLPGSIFTSSDPGNEKQLDESLKALFTYKFYSKRITFKTGAGLISDWLSYTNHLLDIDSGNKVNTLSANAEAEYTYTDKSTVTLGLRSINSRVRTSNYTGIKGRDLVTIDLSANHVFSDLLGLHASLVQELNDFKLLPLSPSVGFDFKPARKTNLHLLGSIGRSNHLPGLNDLYWNPGGNINLLPEESVNSELTISYEYTKHGFKWATNTTAYSSGINNMIVWIPLSQWVWGPENISVVRSTGFEADSKIEITRGQSGISLSAGYAFNRVRRTDSSTDSATNLQLVYVPEHTAYANFLYRVNGICLAWNSEYTGIRYTSTDNTSYLPSNLVHRLSVNYRGQLKRSDFVTAFTLANLFDKDYQSVSGYPLAGRSFSLSLKLNLHL